MSGGPRGQHPGQGDSGAHRPGHVLDHADVESLLGASARGLARVEVAARLGRYGPNQLEEAPPTSSWVLLLHQFTSPLIYILLLAIAVTLLLREYADAIVIAAVLALNAVIGFVQERRAEMSVRALMHLVAPHARAIREGREWDVESRDLVPGDLVLLESGGRVPADLRLVTATALLVDESLTAGEDSSCSSTLVRVKPCGGPEADGDHAEMDVGREPPVQATFSWPNWHRRSAEA